jgi:hypothetical protein
MPHPEATVVPHRTLKGPVVRDGALRALFGVAICGLGAEALGPRRGQSFICPNKNISASIVQPAMISGPVNSCVNSLLSYLRCM